MKKHFKVEIHDMNKRVIVLIFDIDTDTGVYPFDMMCAHRVSAI